MAVKEEILELLENGKITKAIKIFVEHVKENREELLKESETLKEENKINRTDKTFDRISRETFLERTKIVENKLLSLLDKSENDDSDILELEDVLIPKKIFIAYNDTEKDKADELKEVLMKHGALDICDLDDINGSERSEIINKKVKEADVTLAILANKPIESAWLAMETINSFFKESPSGKNFIAAYIHKDFFDWRYRIEGVTKLSNKIKEIDKKLGEGLALGEDFLYLDNEKKRLIKIKDNLEEILSNLKKAPTFDISGMQLKRSIPKMIKTLRK